MGLFWGDDSLQMCQSTLEVDCGMIKFAMFNNYSTAVLNLLKEKSVKTINLDIYKFSYWKDDLRFLTWFVLISEHKISGIFQGR